MMSKINIQIRKAIDRYRIASIQLLVKEFPSCNVGQLKSCLRQADDYRVFQDLGESLVCSRQNQQPSTLSVMRCVALQEFCQAPHKERKLLDKVDLQHYFPTMFRAGLPRGYYIDCSNKKPILGLLRIDTHTADVRRICRRSVDLIEKHRANKSFARLIVSRQLKVTWAVPTPSKADALTLVMRAAGVHAPVEFEFSRSLIKGALQLAEPTPRC